MRNKENHPVRLVITVALEKEVPKEWCRSQGIAVHRLEALMSGSLREGGILRGIMVVITGTGPEKSRWAACRIVERLHPLFVLNIGTCGVLLHDIALGSWMQPVRVSNEEGGAIELERRLPIPFRGRIAAEGNLLSVAEAKHRDVLKGPHPFDLVDMECYPQAQVFQERGVSFQCLKFGSDYADDSADLDFNDNLGKCREKVKDLLGFVSAYEQKVSVVIPVYNRSQTIARAVDSVLTQTYAPDEVIVVDDGSTDRTLSVLKRYGSSIKLVSLSGNAGPAKARNEGIRYARNEWIAFLDSDDEWEPDKLKKDVEYLRRYPFYEIMQSEEKWIRNGARVNKCKHHAKTAGWIFDQSLERCMISPSAVLVKKGLLEKYGMFDETLPVCEDYDLWLKVSRHHPVGLNPAVSVVKYGGHEDQLSRAYPAMDRYRVKTLLSLFKEERNEEYGRKIRSVLKKKLGILIKGSIKRNKSEERAFYEGMLASVDDGRIRGRGAVTP